MGLDDFGRDDYQHNVLWHDDARTRRRCPYDWLFVRGIHRLPMDFPHKIWVKWSYGVNRANFWTNSRAIAVWDTRRSCDATVIVCWGESLRTKRCRGKNTPHNYVLSSLCCVSLWLGTCRSYTFNWHVLPLIPAWISNLVPNSVRRNYLSIPKLQRLHRWSLGMDK